MINLVDFRYSQKHNPNSMAGDSTEVLTIGGDAATHTLTFEYAGNRTTTKETKVNGATDICLFSIMGDVSESTRSGKFIKIDSKRVTGDDVEISGRIDLNRYTWGAAQ